MIGWVISWSEKPERTYKLQSGINHIAGLPQLYGGLGSLDNRPINEKLNRFVIKDIYFLCCYCDM